MIREKKQRVATEAGIAHFATPFAALTMEGRATQDVPTEAVSVAATSAKIPVERLLLRRETAHRGGKTVLVVEGFSSAWTLLRLQELVHEVKSALGCGGKLKERRMEIQGEQADRLQPLLETRGFVVKRGW